MFDQEFLEKIAEEAIRKSEEESHLEETGNELHHFEFDLIKIEPAVFSSGRAGDFYKFSFEYQITLLDEQGLRSKEDDVRIFRRSVRVDTNGKLTGVGGRIEIFD